MRESIIFTILLFLITPLIGAPKENVSMKEIFVGDLFIYTIEFQDGIPKSISYPTGEFFEEGEELPLFKVISSTKTEKSLKLQVRFYASGEFILPIEWEENSKINQSQLKINVQSRLTGSESDIDDNEPPLTFNGPYLHRLIFAILLFLTSAYLVYAMYVYWKKSSKIVNAQWETIPELESRTKKLLQLEELLKNDSIFYKDFCYLFSSYCKEEYSFRLKTDLMPLTDSNFLAYLYDHGGLEEADLREMRNVFRNVKYSDHIKRLTKEEANTLLVEWKSKLKI